MNEELLAIAKAFKIPVVGDSKHIWFLRTQAGTFYTDYYINNYVALGWDDIPIDLIQDGKTSYKVKREKVEELYPEEKRPGLILGQMETFYNEMQSGDLIIIPAYSSKAIAIGVLGEITTTVKHAIADDDYSHCEYKHKRSVNWQKEIDLWNDVYLFRALRAQQTISDITDYADMVYRNLYSFYISGDAVHFTMQKVTVSDYRISDNISLLSSILSVNHALAELWNTPDESEKIKYKTAVGSPGFMEIIMPLLPISAISTVVLVNALIGKVKTGDGQFATGIMAIITKANDLLNDRENRKKTKAEVAQIESTTKKTDAETIAIQASTQKTIAETESIKIANEIAKRQLYEEKMSATVKLITESCDTLQKSAANSGIRFSGNIEEAS